MTGLILVRQTAALGQVIDDLVLVAKATTAVYLYLARVSVPILGTGFTATPEVSGARSIVHVVLFLTFFYLGFIRKWKSRSIK